MLWGLVLQVVVKVVILADCPGTREAHFNPGSRHDSRVPEYPLRTFQKSGCACVDLIYGTLISVYIFFSGRNLS